MRADDTTRAVELLRAHPAIGPLSIRTAAAAGDLEVVHRQLRADPSRATQAIPPDFTPPLIYAVESSVKRAIGVSSDVHVAIVEALLDAGASPNTSVPLPENGGAIPALFFPCMAGNAPVTRLLLERGVAVDATRSYGRTAYQVACRAGNAQAAMLLQEAGADVTRGTIMDRFVGACVAGQVDEARRFLVEFPELSETLDEEGEEGGTPLHVAAWHGHEALVALLLAHAAPVNRRDSRYGSSPIAWAAHGSRFSQSGDASAYAHIVAMLLDAGATRSESFNRWGESPELLATEAVARVLETRGFTMGSPE